MDSSSAEWLAEAGRGDAAAFSRLAEPFRRELQAHCYRMLGSLQDAEDQVQETMLRAWRRLDTFEGRAPFRAWLYKIATHACLDALDRRPARRLPPAVYPPSDPRAPVAAPVVEPMWLEPFPDDGLPDGPDPEARYTLRESITLAFLVALQALPPRQRAVLLLRDVLDWSAAEAAECLEMTVSAVNSALHRARATLAKRYHGREPGSVSAPLTDKRTRELLDRYVQAWEAADVAGLVAVLKEDVTVAMPPSPAWYRGRESVGDFAAANIFIGPRPDRWRLRPARANAQPAFAMYEREAADGTFRARGLQVLTLDPAGIAEIVIFLDPPLVARFGLPVELTGG